MKTKDNELNLIFLNTPISNECQDVIGVSKYVDKLNSAIDAGAQMIAVTSPFGSGKSSVTELLEQKRINKKKERFIKVSMWTQFHGDNKNASTTDLHRDFVYQLSHQIDSKRGTYISRRLSPNYSLLKLHVNKAPYWLITIFVIILLALSWSIKAFPEQIKLLFSDSKGSIDTLATALAFLGIILGVIVITKAEIIFAGKKTEEKRKIESSEIIDLYRDEILKYKKKIKKKGMCYLVVIEDLDRTSDAEAVIGFLKELRKYYVPQTNRFNKATKYCNKVVFVVNVKPEKLLLKEMKKQVVENEESEKCKGINISEKEESLYAKLFDYILNLQTINIDNYDAILEGLLQEKKEAISKIGLSTEGKLVELPGMQWIIRDRGHGIGIREIKERLNIAFSLYESLIFKFPDSGTTFEKCAAVSYLTTAFEYDFNNTDDRAFQKLVNLYLQNNISDENASNILKDASPRYVSTVKELITAKLIDNNYRTYFYNYPKGSYLYSSDETQIINAILYGEQLDDLEEVAKRVVTAESSAPKRAFKILEKLGLMLPKIIFQSETLYIEALKEPSEKVFKYIENMIYSNETAEKTIEFFKKILNYDKSRIIFNNNFANRLCDIWEENYSETSLLQLRAILCNEFSSEIIWYKQLFFGRHTMIKTEEMDLCSLTDSISLINLDSEDFDISIAEYIQIRFSKQEDIDSEVSSKVEDFLRSAREKLDVQLIVPLYLGYMDKVSRIVADFEKETFDLIMDEETSDKVQQDIFILYQAIINKTSESLSKQTIGYITRMKRYNGYNHRVADQIEINRYYLDYTLLLVHQNRPISFKSEEINQALSDDIKWLISNKEYLLLIRKELTKCKEDILSKYLFMFSVDAPVLTSEELDSIKSNIEASDQTVMKLIPADLVSEDNYKMLTNYFNRKRQTNSISFEILMYISKFLPEISKLCFYDLDFDMVRYRYISAARKSKIKHVYSDVLELDSPHGKIEFMKATKDIDSAWEKALLDSLINDKELQKSYVEIVNNRDSITDNTIETLCKLGSIYQMSPIVNQKLLENKKYTQYVASETMGNSSFNLPENELRDELWPTYIKIFSSSGYTTTRKYMAKNHHFVSKIMRDKSYIGFEEENRMQLNGVYQDKDSILNVMEYGSEFALRYYSSIRGFLDETAATAFVKQVGGSSELIASDALYNHTYNKLNNKGLKARYTNIRKKHGYERRK